MKRILMVLLFALALAACAPDPRNAAEAEATLLRAQQDAYDQEYVRQQKQAREDILLQEQLETSQQNVSSWKFFTKTWWFFFTFSASAATGIILMGLSAGTTWALVGIGRATSNAAANKARQISMDPETGSYPALTYEGHGLITVTDINTGKTVRMDTRNEADRQMVAAAFAVRMNSAMAYNARKAKDSDSSGVAMVGTRPVIVGARDGGLSVGEIYQEDEHAAD